MLTVRFFAAVIRQYRHLKTVSRRFEQLLHSRNIIGRIWEPRKIFVVVLADTDEQRPADTILLIQTRTLLRVDPHGRAPRTNRQSKPRRRQRHKNNHCPDHYFSL